MDVLESVLKNLNDEQKQAVKATEGFIRVVAGAGSGKTRVLTTRYVYLAKALDIAVDKILSVTFTNKASREMKSRIQRFMPDEDGGWVLTFHSACHKILKEDITRLAYPANFQILDDDDQKKLLEKIYADNELTVKNFSYKECLAQIEAYKRENDYVPFLIDPESKTQPDNLPLGEIRGTIDFIIKRYLVEQRKNFYLDFDDLMTFTLYLFSVHPDVKEKWQNHFEYIQVDEFQDVSARQYEFVKILSQKHGNLFIVGDPDQTIYSWRGSDVKIFLGFDKDFPYAKTILLTTNYRSTPEILAVSNSLIKHNKDRIDKQLVAVKASGAKPLFRHSATVRAESDWITDKILQLKESGESLNGIAILYRSNTYSRNIEEALMRKRVPYALYSGYKFYQRSEIKTALSYLKMLVYDDDLAFERIYNTPARGIGKKKKKLIDDYAKLHGVSAYEAFKTLAQGGDFGKAQSLIDTVEEGRAKLDKLNPADLLDFVLKSSGLEASVMLDGNEERLENINDLKLSVKEYVDGAGEKVSLTDYLNDLSLLTDADKTEKQDCVKMMTVHTAKGLEYPYVFVCGLNESVFPSKKVKTREDMEEERRIAYVAYTRAEKGLFLTDAEGFNSDGAQLKPSRFILNVEPNLLEHSGTLSKQAVQQAQDYIATNEHWLNLSSKPSASSTYKVGDLILHKIFGKGKILQVNAEGLSVQFGEKQRTLALNAKITLFDAGDSAYEFALSVLQENGVDLNSVCQSKLYHTVADGALVLTVQDNDDYLALTRPPLSDKIKECLEKYDIPVFVRPLKLSL